MSHDRVETTPYEPPTIETRAPISLPLIGSVSQINVSAAFRPL